MRHVNKSFGKLFGFSGLFVNRRNWFLCAIFPARQGQTFAIALLLGTHKRYGLLIGRRWIFNGMNEPNWLKG